MDYQIDVRNVREAEINRHTEDEVLVEIGTKIHRKKLPFRLYP